MDLQAQDLWDEFTEKKYRMLRKTHTPLTPWSIIRSDSKHKARIETAKVILNAVRYRGRSPDLDFEPDPGIVIDGARELEIMKQQIAKSGKPKR